MVISLLLSRFSRIRLCATPQTAATRLPHPWDSPGKTTGVGCHFLLQCMKVKSESEFAQSCPTPSDPMDCSLPGPSVHGIFRARVQEWVAIAFSGYFSTKDFSIPQIELESCLTCYEGKMLLMAVEFLSQTFQVHGIISVQLFIVYTSAVWAAQPNSTYKLSPYQESIQI